MKICIYRETGSLPLDAAMLAEHVQADGFVVFVSGRVRQRAIAHAVVNLLEAEGIAAVPGEADSPNGCMCVVDMDRCTLSQITLAAAQEDLSYENGPHGS